MRLIILAAAALATLPGAANAQTIVADAVAAPTRPGQADARVTATVTVHGTDTITGGASPIAASVMAHTVRRRSAAGDVMEPAGIPVTGTRRLSVHGYHLMLMGLRRPLKAGDTFPLTVRFAKGPPVTTTVRVAAR